MVDSLKHQSAFAASALLPRGDRLPLTSTGSGLLKEAIGALVPAGWFDLNKAMLARWEQDASGMPHIPSSVMNMTDRLEECIALDAPCCRH